MKKLLRTFTTGAFVAAVASVTALSMGCAGDQYQRSKGASLDDKSIAAKIRSDLIGDPDVKARNVKVNVFKGDVELSGYVDTAMEKEKAEQIARNVNGVSFVKNDLLVRSRNEAAGSQP